MSQLVAQLRQIARNFARQAKRRRGWCFWRRPGNPAWNAYAIVAAIAADRILELEKSMRTADDAVKALVADDKALRQQVSDLQAENTTLKANAITGDTLAAVNELVPEAVTPDVQP